MIEQIKKVHYGAEFSERLKNNSKRLTGSFYHPEELLKNKNREWPGDWTGRTLLAYVSLWDVTGKNQPYFNPVFDNIKAYTNEYYYFGEVIDENNINEQQLAGNSWYLRALCLYYQLTQDEKTKEYINSVMQHLYNPLIAYIEKYPDVIPVEMTGEMAGGIIRKYGDWRLSSDVGCMYISLDGIAHAYEITRDKETEKLLHKMLAKFFAVDKAKNFFQTHATLTALRGAMKFYEIIRDPKILSEVEREVKIYLNCGMSANFANFNWFNRPEWTEPCAIVDSFILFFNIYRATGEVKYLTLANQVYFNALVFAQRDNGGFGCDVCVNEEKTVLQCDALGGYEAFWCCSMRGAEGLRNVARCAFWEEDNTLRLLVPMSGGGEFLNGKLTAEFKVEYPYGNKISIEIISSERGDIEIYLPYVEKITANTEYTYRDGFFRMENVRPGAIEIEYETPVRKSNYKGMTAYDKGVLRLGWPIGEFADTLYGDAECTEFCDGRKLIPVPPLYRYARPDAVKVNLQMLF